MEIVLAAFIGLWLSGASLLAYRQLKKDFKCINEKDTDNRGDKN